MRTLLFQVTRRFLIGRGASQKLPKERWYLENNLVKLWKMLTIYLFNRKYCNMLSMFMCVHTQTTDCNWDVKIND